ncbi:MFS transporter [Qipengyuania sp.]|uniref:MFS transporter n=1 Tax=Qipengyuania sp. TaxID=2004515 RepID=UPI0035C7A255
MDRQSPRFLALYALAWAGGATAYVPFLTVLLPARVAQIAGPETIHWMGYLAFVGAIAASLSNILAGWISDIVGSRNAPAVLGLCAYAVLTPLFGGISDLPTLLLTIAAWQISLNFVLGPIAALAADVVPNKQKGTLGGLLAFAPAAGALAGVVVTMRGFADFQARLWIIDCLVIAMIAPLILLSRPRPIDQSALEPPARSASVRRDFRPAQMWLARLLVQISEATLFAFLYLWLRSIDQSFDDATAARIVMAMMLAGIPVSIAAGRWSDIRGEPFLPLRVFAAASALGLAIMALATSLTVALVGYALFSLVTLAFLSLHSAQVLRVLPKPDRRGRDLGIFNLTNTVPSLIMPWLAIGLLPELGFTALFAVLAVLAAIAPLVVPRR